MKREDEIAMQDASRRVKNARFAYALASERRREVHAQYEQVLDDELAAQREFIAAIRGRDRLKNAAADASVSSVLANLDTKEETA